MAITPMMQQYLQIKDANNDCILFFRLGDFYEMFFDDAVLVSRELELTLTGKDCGLSERAPMCGIPHHALETYLSRLVANGHKVAICEQMTDPSESKGIVERAITRIVTPGTVIETSMLSDGEPNYISSVAIRGDKAGIAFCDVSTGEFFVHSIQSVCGGLNDELSRIAPREIVLSDDPSLKHLGIGVQSNALITKRNGSWFDNAQALSVLKKHFQVSNADQLGLKGETLCVCAAGALMQYLEETQKNALCHITQIKRFEQNRHMTLDQLACTSLELTLSGRAKSRRGSLLWTMDKTMTAMGSRMLRNWIEQPLLQKDAILERFDAVEYLKDNPIEADNLRAQLKDVYDIERLLSKIAYDTVNARDCLALKRSLHAVPQIKNILQSAKPSILRSVDQLILPLPELAQLLEDALLPDAPISVKDGGIFKPGFNEQLDKYHIAATDGKSWIAKLEQEEREQTGIKNLKIGFNRVFGYYIEVTKSFYELIPYRYARKQTLANCERFTTQELKNLEKTILGADEQAVKLEYELFSRIREQLKTCLCDIQLTAQGLKTLDALLSLAQVANENGYVRPALNENGIIDIKDGRHPVVEQSLGRERFVPNDTDITDQNMVMVITGPNMAGKSTYMRQVALIVLLAHMGSFVPASSANIPLTDRIFTRIGASDDLYGGQSTFMVEMVEMANILKHATDRSLLILDEVGRGTSTFDGLSIAWATVEHIAKKTRARTMFATHYHELSELEGQLPGVVDYRITAKEQGEDVIFLRKIVKGAADRSYGVAVASLAGLPASLIARARQIMARLEVNGQTNGSIGQHILDKRKNAGNRQVGLTDYRSMEFVEELRDIDVTALTPIEALNKLYVICEKARRI